MSTRFSQWLRWVECAEQENVQRLSHQAMTQLTMVHETWVVGLVNCFQHGTTPHGLVEILSE